MRILYHDTSMIDHEQIMIRDTIMLGNAEGIMVGGMAFEDEDYDSGKSVIKVQYITSVIQASYVECQVGTLMDPNMKEFFAGDGDLLIDGSQYKYTYDPAAPL